jgi:type IV pilus biogenesis protein CpaD/CtpE
MGRRLLVVLGVAMAVQLGACSTAHEMTLKDDFGNSVRTNVAVQTINPEAGKKDMPAPTLDGQKAAKAVDNYRKQSEKAETETLLKGVTQ